MNFFQWITTLLCGLSGCCGGKEVNKPQAASPYLELEMRSLEIPGLSEDELETKNIVTIGNERTFAHRLEGGILCLDKFR